jgi:hypothetical protein
MIIDTSSGKKQSQAYVYLRQAVKEGRLKRSDFCELCDKKNVRLISHHWNGYDFENALNVWTICDRCNRLLKDRHDGSLTKRQARQFVANYLTTREVVEELNTIGYEVRKRIEAGQVPGVKISTKGDLQLIPKASLDYLRDCPKRIPSSEKRPCNRRPLRISLSPGQQRRLCHLSQEVGLSSPSRLLQIIADNSSNQDLIEVLRRLSASPDPGPKKDFFFSLYKKERNELLNIAHALKIISLYNGLVELLANHDNNPMLLNKLSVLLTATEDQK